MSPQRTAAKIALLVDDDPADTRLTLEGIRNPDIRNAIHVLNDGDDVLPFLRRESPFEHAPRPDLIILDVNLPKRSGLDLLQEIKLDPDLSTIPVVMLSTSNSPCDVAASYARHANCFITKPIDLDAYLDVIAAIESFWLGVVALPEVRS
jgi:CheY-like chemotaxis protein